MILKIVIILGGYFSFFFHVKSYGGYKMRTNGTETFLMLLFVIVPGGYQLVKTGYQLVID